MKNEMKFCNEYRVNFKLEAVDIISTTGITNDTCLRLESPQNGLQREATKKHS